jgi:hypothetical protein
MTEISVITLALFRDKQGREIMLYGAPSNTIALLYKPRKSPCWYRVKVISKDKQTSSMIAWTKVLGERRWQVTPTFCNIEGTRHVFDRIYPDIVEIVGTELLLMNIHLCAGE